MALNLALYLRLSKEDGDLIDESNSITNQRYLVRNYIEKHPELISYAISEYIDDGYSGKNFDRPGIKQLFQDMREGKIYGVIVKDLSRFGRNHTEVGDYVEKIFPLLDIRFLAVNNGFDSNNYIGSTPDMSIAFENLMYDYYSVENSVKVKNDLMKKRKRGNFMATFAAYGYKKSECDHNQLLIDEEAADVVRLIFDLYLEHGSKAEVARCLNSRGIPTPQEYAQGKGVSYKWKYQEEKKSWRGSIVGRILKNQVYIGNMLFHKKQVVEIGSRKTKTLPKEEWMLCENTHEAIISKELFEKANQIAISFRKEKQENKKVQGQEQEHYHRKGTQDQTLYCEGEKRRRGNPNSPIKGFVKCGGCRHAMTRRNRYLPTYYCRHYYDVHDENCCSVNIKEEILSGIVLEAIRKQALLVADLKELYGIQKAYLQQRVKRRESEKKTLLNRVEQLRIENFSSYEKYQEGKIGKDELKRIKDKNNAIIAELERRLADYEMVESNITGEEDLRIFEVFGGIEVLSRLTRDVVEQLVESIYVYDSNCVEVVFRFMDEMVLVMEKIRA